jgi:hypothetical protein
MIGCRSIPRDAVVAKVRQIPIESSSRPEMNSPQHAPIVPYPSGHSGDDLRSERQPARSDLLEVRTADDVLGNAPRHIKSARCTRFPVPPLSARRHHSAGVGAA